MRKIACSSYCSFIIYSIFSMMVNWKSRKLKTRCNFVQKGCTSWMVKLFMYKTVHKLTQFIARWHYAVIGLICLDRQNAPSLSSCHKQKQKTKDTHQQHKKTRQNAQNLICTCQQFQKTAVLRSCPAFTDVSGSGYYCNKPPLPVPISHPCSFQLPKSRSL